jgi:hypothetical protein
MTFQYRSKTQWTSLHFIFTDRIETPLSGPSFLFKEKIKRREQESHNFVDLEKSDAVSRIIVSDRIQISVDSVTWNQSEIIIIYLLCWIDF